MTDTSLSAPAGQTVPAALSGFAESPSERTLAQAPVKTNTFAIISLAGALVVSLVGIVFGHIALAQIKKTGEPGRGFAIAGLAVGYASIALSISVISCYAVALVALVGLAGAAGGSNY